VKKRASLTDRPVERGRGIDAFFEAPADQAPREELVGETWRAATFNLYPRHQDFLDDFVRRGKREFRRKTSIGVGAINKSLVLQTLLEFLEEDDVLQGDLLARLEEKERQEGSRHAPQRAQ
jgi:hypothetical protein